MECYFAKGTVCTDKESDEYIHINNFGYSKEIDKDISVLRKKGRVDYQIIYIDKGYGYFLIDNKKTKLEKGTVIILRPGEKNCYEFPKTSLADYYWIHFTGTGAPVILRQLKLCSSVFEIGNCLFFKKKMMEMSKACAVEDFTTETFLVSALLSILSAIAKKMYIVDTPIRKVIEKMQTEKLNISNNSDYARIYGVSEYHFIRTFKKITGLTPHQYKVKMIIQKAAELLITTNFNISETANVLGFEDSLYFSRAFKKVMGISPRDYILKYK